MDLKKKSFIEDGESCLKITLQEDLGRLVKKYRIAI